MAAIQFVTTEEAKNSVTIKLLYTGWFIGNIFNILFAVILIKATIRNK
jgi:hypothetical protein